MRNMRKQLTKIMTAAAESVVEPAASFNLKEDEDDDEEKNPFKTKELLLGLFIQLVK